MKWSWKMAQIAGIGVYVHATFLILIFGVALNYWQQEQTIRAVLGGIGFMLALFGSVLLHEFGHALTARRYGIRTRDITLLPIGGLARLERMPEKPHEEFVVALAGPAVNVVIAALLLVFLRVEAGRSLFTQIDAMRGSFVERLMAVNVILAGFNMIPAFPMDGGRVLRSLLAARMDYTRATHWAALLGQGIALLFGFIGFFTNPFLLFVALFVWIGAAQEASMVQIKSALGGIPVSRAMLTDFRTLSVGDTLARAVELVLAGSQPDFPVVEDGRVVGVLTRADMLIALARQGQEVSVRDVMQRQFPSADPTEMLEGALPRLQECQLLPVIRLGRLVGLVTHENVGEFISIQAALGKDRRQAPVVV